MRAPTLRVYPRETVIAEELEAMVSLDIANSRTKDFYDIVVLSREFDFDGISLVKAITATFARRGTALPSGAPLALTGEFAENAAKKVQWEAFVRNAGIIDADNFVSTVNTVSSFLSEPLAAAGADTTFESHWPKGGPWMRDGNA